MSEQAVSLQITDLPTDILGDIFSLIGKLGCTILSHVSKGFKKRVRGLTIDRIEDSVCCVAAENNQFEVLKWAKSTGYTMYALPFYMAEHDNIEMLEWIVSNNDRQSMVDSGDIIVTYECAAKSGQLGIIKWLHSHDYEICDLRDIVAQYGHCHIIEWLCTIGAVVDSRMFIEAAKANQFEALKCLHDMKQPNDRIWSSEATDSLASHGNIDALEWLHLEGCDIGPKVAKAAAQAGQFATLKWLYKKRFPMNLAYQGAAQIGQFAILEWLVNIGIPMDSRTRDEAALYGRIDVLKWLDANNCPRSGSDHDAAANGGHIDILKWLLENNAYTNNSRLCSEAARGGHLEVLKWLRSEGYPCDEYVCYTAITGCYFDIFEWLYENGCPRDIELCAECATEAGCSYGPDYGIGLKILKYLYNDGCPLDNTELCANAAMTNDFIMLKWLREHGCPWNERTCEMARSQTVREWIHENGCPCEHSAD